MKNSLNFAIFNKYAPCFYKCQRNVGRLRKWNDFYTHTTFKLYGKKLTFNTLITMKSLRMILAKTLTSLLITNASKYIFMPITKTFLTTNSACGIAKTAFGTKLAESATGIFLAEITLPNFVIAFGMAVATAVNTTI